MIRNLKYYLPFFILLLIYNSGCLAYADSLFIISNITVSGNKVTHEKIIIRELTFREGDTVSAVDLPLNLERSRENVLNTSLFNFVTINYNIEIGNNISVFIILVERWYLWPVPLFEHAERNLGAFFNNPDWNKINYGLQLNWNNFRGRKENLVFKARFGYKEQFLMTYNKPNIGTQQKIGILAGINKFRMHEVHTTTIGNKPVYLKSDSIYLYEDLSASLNLSYRNYLYLKHSLMLSYMEISFRDSLRHIDFLGIPYQQKSRFFSLEYMIEYDFRDSKTYPLKGQYLRVILRQRGLGIIPEYNQIRNSMILYGSYHKQWTDRWYHNQAALIKVSNDKRDPAVYRTGIGYVGYVRGYELYTVEGTSSLIFSNNLKYCFSHEKTFTIPLIPWPQFNKTHLSFYGNLFVDGGYARGNFHDPNNNSFINKFLYSVGLGLDVVSYYDQVIRFETSVNRQGNFGFFVSSEIPFKRW